jgi:hypothetical protein
MAGRIRTIKPELREDPAIAALTDGAWRLFVSLYTLVDDTGRCPAGASFLAGAVFFARPRAPHVVGQLLAEIAQAGLVSLYDVNGARYLEIRGWREMGSVTHQRISKPQPARYSPPSTTDSAQERGPIPQPREDVPPTSDLRPPTTDHDRELPRARAISGPSTALPHPAPAAERARQVPEPRVKINHDAWAYAAAKHAELRAAGIGVTAVPFPPMPAGVAQEDLVARTKEIATDGVDYAAAMEVHRRRIDVLVAECRREQHLKWFTPPRIWEARTFWKAAYTTPEDASEPRTERKPPWAAEPSPLRLVVDDDELPPSRFGAYPAEKATR